MERKSCIKKRRKETQIRNRQMSPLEKMEETEAQKKHMDRFKCAEHLEYMSKCINCVKVNRKFHGTNFRLDCQRACACTYTRVFTPPQNHRFSHTKKQTD